jgi:hypothetical protein
MSIAILRAFAPLREVFEKQMYCTVTAQYTPFT